MKRQFVQTDKKTGMLVFSYVDHGPRSATPTDRIVQIIKGSVTPTNRSQS